MNGQLSEHFKALARAAWERAMDPTLTPDDAIRYMAQHIPLYLNVAATPDQAAAAGCPSCTYLGMWTDNWPGIPRDADHQHGSIWLFEAGILGMRGDPVANVYEVLVHEMGHALQRDHVLDAMEAERRAGVAGYQPAARGCDCPGMVAR